MTKPAAGAPSKIPEVTLGFWIIKVVATTLGETGGDAVTMSMHLGYAIGSVIFIGIFAAAVFAQISAKSFHPFLYWVTIVATTTLGTTMADFADRSLGIGYFGRIFDSVRGADRFSGRMALVRRLHLRRYRRDAAGRDILLDGDPVLTDARHGLGDWMADTNGLGYEGGAVAFGVGLALVAAAYFYTKFRTRCCFGRRSF